MKQEDRIYWMKKKCEILVILSILSKVDMSVPSLESTHG